ncbi:MAG: WG repeat-containing protein [Clostridia bacterium]|nr:WG repeat-containing protein [Clostridia bacterium]
MKQRSADIIITVISVILLCAITVAVILYAEGKFDKTPETTGETHTKAPTTEAPETEPASSAAPVTDPVVTTEEAFDLTEHEKLISNYGVMNDGYKASEDLYDPGSMKILRLVMSGLPDSDDENDLMTRIRYKVTYSGSERSFEPAEQTEQRRAVDVYMGMLVVSDKGALSFYNGNGELLYSYSDEAELKFAYERDKEDRPLFIKDGKYYYIDEELKELKPSDYDARDSRGLYYNYPSYFGKADGQFTVFRSGNLYGINRTDGTKLRNAIYQEAYNYSEGLGAVDYKGDICYMNEKGKVVIENKVKTENQILVGCRDEGGIGALYFDGGYVRMRKIYYDIRKTVIEDKDVLINKEGAEFKMPTGYKFESYSNQRIMLSKNGYYGFYATKGAWIADTVYTYATPYYEGLAVVGSRTGKKGVIDLDGNFVIPLSYSHISVCSGGVIVCFSPDYGYDVFVKAARADAR